MLIKKIRFRVWLYVALFILGLIVHILCVRVFVLYIGPTLAIWVDGLIMTVITIVTIHGLGRLLAKYKDFFPNAQKYDVVRWCTYGIFWSTFAVHMWSFFFNRQWLDLTGWVSFMAVLTAIITLSSAVLLGLLPAMRHRGSLPHHKTQICASA